MERFPSKKLGIGGIMATPPQIILTRSSKIKINPKVRMS